MLCNNALSLFSVADAAEYVSVIFLTMHRHHHHVLKSEVQRYYATSNLITYYDYNLWKVVLITEAIQ